MRSNYDLIITNLPTKLPFPVRVKKVSQEKLASCTLNNVTFKFKNRAAEYFRVASRGDRIPPGVLCGTASCDGQ